MYMRGSKRSPEHPFPRILALFDIIYDKAAFLLKASFGHLDHVYTKSLCKLILCCVLRNILKVANVGWVMEDYIEDGIQLFHVL